MRQLIMGTFRTSVCSVTGYRKAQGGSPCEDAARVLRLGKFTVVAASDGHGDQRCVLAHVGSQLAVKSACVVLGQYGKKLEKNSSSEYWNSKREEIAAEVVKAFARNCLEDYINRFNNLSPQDQQMLFEYVDGFNKKSNEALTPQEIRERYAQRKAAEGKLEKILYLYGTTLRASVIGGKYIFSMAIGDGDTVMLTDRGVRWLIPKSPAFETGTYSMCDSFSEILSEFMFSYTDIQKEETGLGSNSYNMKMIMLSTDGFRNSFYDDDDFCAKVGEIYLSLQKRGTKHFSRTLKRLFTRLTRESVYQDDITAVVGSTFDS